MGSVQVFVTGFGSFHGVPSNPTQRIVSWLHDQYVAGGDQGAQARRGLKHGHVARCTILKVSARAVNNYLKQQLEQLNRRSYSTYGCARGCGPASACCSPAGHGGGNCGSGSSAHEPPAVVLLLHFGADVHRPWFNLETRAINIATFRSPDEDGWKPDSCPIAAVPGMPLGWSVNTDLDLASIARQLRGRGHDVQLSADAGKFVCNYTYYNSLALCRQATAVATAATVAAAVAAAAAASDGGASGCCNGSGGSDAASEASGGSLGRSDSGGSCWSGQTEAAMAATPCRSSGGSYGGGRIVAVHSLFVHVPAFESICEEKQLHFAADLVESLCGQLHQAYFGQQQHELQQGIKGASGLRERPRHRRQRLGRGSRHSCSGAGGGSGNQQQQQQWSGGGSSSDRDSSGSSMGHQPPVLPPLVPPQPAQLQVGQQQLWRASPQQALHRQPFPHGISADHRGALGGQQQHHYMYQLEHAMQQQGFQAPMQHSSLSLRWLHQQWPPAPAAAMPPAPLALASMGPQHPQQQLPPRQQQHQTACYVSHHVLA